MKKYKFNDKTLEYERVKPSLKRRLWLIVRILGLSVLLIFSYYLIFSFFFSQKELRSLTREREIVQRERDRLLGKVEVLENSTKDMQQRDAHIYYQIFNTETPDFFSVQTNEQTRNFANLKYREAVEQTALSLENIESESLLVDKMLDSIQTMVLADVQALRNIPSIAPIENFSLRKVGASLGNKIHPYYKTVTFHDGLDLIAPEGTKVLASADGIVVKINTSKRGGGNEIVIDHQNGYTTVYSHLSEILIRNGRKVKRGDVIGEVGSTGVSFAPHLHYEVKLKNEPQEPINFFTTEYDSEQYIIMMRKAVNTGQSLD